jgi:hypothetical protein
VTQCGDVTTSIGGEAAPRRKRGGNDISWVNTNLTEKKNKKNHAVDSTGTNGR